MGTHYNKNYFNWQKNVGAFGGIANLFKFKDFIKVSDNVIDYGCGGGYLLANINCREKIGIDINEQARKACVENGIKAVQSIKEIENEWADVIISNSALEHTFRPLDELINLRPKLKKGGKVVFLIPHEIKIEYKPNDINQHLYTWSPMCAGNLFTTAGYKVLKVEKIKHLWPPQSYRIRKYCGQIIFDIVCKLYCRLFGTWYQVRVIAEK